MLNQNFPVIYKNNYYMVDPMCLNNASRKFHDLIQPFLNQGSEVGKMNLQIVYDKFSNRNVENFLKLCQNLPTDCQNNEIEEICEIAKMFQADQIYNTGINFVRSNIDPNFNVPDQEFDESKGRSFLVLSAVANKVHHLDDLNSLEFDEDNCQQMNNNYIYNQNNNNNIININNQNNNVSNSQIYNNQSSCNQNYNNLSYNNDFNNQTNNNASNYQNYANTNTSYNQNSNTSFNQSNINLNNQNGLNQREPQGIDPTSSCQINLNASQQNSINQFSNQENIDPNAGSNSENKQNEVNKPRTHSIIYEIKIEPQLMKLPIIHFIADGQVVYTAKHKDSTIVIGKGPMVHLNKDRTNHIAKITMQNGVNCVSCEGQEFHVSFIYFSGPGTFSIATDFLHQKKCLHWRPKEPKYNKAHNSYTLSLHGEYHHFPLKSTKNTVLINDLDESCLIIRKVAEDEFEAECNPTVSQIIIFSLALSQIIGPNSAYANVMRMNC